MAHPRSVDENSDVQVQVSDHQRVSSESRAGLPPKLMRNRRALKCHIFILCQCATQECVSLSHGVPLRTKFRGETSHQHGAIVASADDKAVQDLQSAQEENVHKVTKMRSREQNNTSPTQLHTHATQMDNTRMCLRRVWNNKRQIRSLRFEMLLRKSTTTPATQHFRTAHAPA